MSQDAIIRAAIGAEAERHGALSKHLVLAALDGTAIKVIDGEALQSEVRAHVARVRRDLRNYSVISIGRRRQPRTKRLKKHS